MGGSPQEVGDRGTVHGRTLHGAIDTHLGDLAHNRPWLLHERTDALGEVAAAWAQEGGANRLPSLRPAWVSRHLTSLRPEVQEPRAEALADFLRWAAEQGLVPPGQPVALDGIGGRGINRRRWDPEGRRRRSGASGWQP